jgi:nitroreductase
MKTAASPMSALEAIIRRRAIRSYLPTRVDQETVRKLLVAAVWAPTAMHEEPWAFTVIQDAAVLKRISDSAKVLLVDDALRGGRHLRAGEIDRFTSPDFNIFYDAGTLITIYCLPVSPYAKGDCWLAAENLMIAACAMGLGTCVIGLGLPAMNQAQIKAELKVPPEMTAVVPIIVGIPRGEPQPSHRKDPQILSWR